MFRVETKTIIQLQIGLEIALFSLSIWSILAKWKSCYEVLFLLGYGCIYKLFHKNAASNIEQVMEAAPHKAAAVQPLTTHHENYQS